ncbi:hypothetical protein [Rhodococcus sp. NPDC058481]|uniref:hypothetical protein n=1 Tax=unclassified Rhodococcus (in: high G+C Gram-positive bacteria) TaxID=192944 RepID=UPI0036482756
MKRTSINWGVWMPLLTLGLIAGCAAAESINPYPDSPAAVFSKNGHTGPRDLPEVPELPAPTTPGARFTLDGLWSGTAVSDDPADLSCTYDAEDKSRTYNVTTQTTSQFSGVDNYPTEDFYSLSVVVMDETRLEGTDEWTAQAIVAFADSTGTYVQMAAPDSNSIAVHASDDKSAVAFSMINTAEGNRSEGSPTTAVGTITCPH